MPELIPPARITVVVLGAALFVFAAWGFVNPRNLLRAVKATMDADWGIWLAVVILRLGVGDCGSVGFGLVGREVGLVGVG